jgi:glyoxylase-like metal-dependent hydrolase (beta-lactamase superfamily II)/rhodanese-related sulfurtransferase
MFDVIVVETPSLGDRSYLVHDGTAAFVVDPQRDIDRVLDAAAGVGVSIVDVFETHIHNDYVTGGYALASTCGARYHVNAEDPVAFDRHPVVDGDRVVVSPHLTVHAVASPGHTHTHLSYQLEHDGLTVAVFTGGSLLYGSAGRPDLLGPDHTDGLVHAQWASAHRLASAAPDAAAVWPTHGFGSFCSASQSEAVGSTIGHERATNPVLTQSEDAWVEGVLAGLDAWPEYYVRMGPANLSGPAAPDLSPPPASDATEIAQRVSAGEWVVDLRHRKAFSEGHVPGSLSLGSDGSLATYLGWVIPWGTPLTLLGDTADDIAAAQRELVRVGIDRPAAAAIGGLGAWVGHKQPETLERATFAELEAVRRRRPITILDVRRRLEWVDGHLDGATHIPLHELADRLDEIRPGEIWVHCRSGYRASIAASMLQRAGRTVVLVDEDLTDAAAAGSTVLARPGG